MSGAFDGLASVPSLRPLCFVGRMLVSTFRGAIHKEMDGEPLNEQNEAALSSAGSSILIQGIFSRYPPKDKYGVIQMLVTVGKSALRAVTKTMMEEVKQ